MPAKSFSKSLTAQQIDEEVGNLANAGSMGTRKLFFKAGASLMALLLASSTILAVLDHRRTHRTIRMLSSKPESTSTHNVSGFIFEPNGTSTDQGGIDFSSLPRIAVSTMQMCNYARVPIIPAFGQFPGTPYYWQLKGDQVSNGKCYMFDPLVFGEWAFEGSPINCEFLPEGAKQWYKCRGAGVVYQRKSNYAGEYACSGYPLTCVYNFGFVYRRR